MASNERDAQAKTFSVKPDKANIYVYRSENMGAGVKMDVFLDGKPVGQTVASSYFALEVAPGKHTLVSKAENDSVLDLDAESGKNYFIWQEVKMGFLYARNQLHIVDDATGKAGIADCKLIETAKSPGRVVTSCPRGHCVTPGMAATLRTCPPNMAAFAGRNLGDSPSVNMRIKKHGNGATLSTTARFLHRITAIKAICSD